MVGNIPAARDTQRQIDVRIDQQTIQIVNVSKADPKDYSIMERIYVGDFLLQAEKYDDLRDMIGREVARAVIDGRDAGYRQAKQEIRDALGIERKW